MNWLKVGLQLVPLIIQAIHSTEQLLSRKGAEKEEHALELVASGVKLAEEISGKDLVRDQAVQPALREFIRAYVALQNAVRAARALPPTV